jgi:hypothetical protein
VRVRVGVTDVHVKRISHSTRLGLGADRRRRHRWRCAPTPLPHAGVLDSRDIAARRPLRGAGRLRRRTATPTSRRRWPRAQLRSSAEERGLAPHARPARRGGLYARALGADGHAARDYQPASSRLSTSWTTAPWRCSRSARFSGSTAPTRAACDRHHRQRGQDQHQGADRRGAAAALPHAGARATSTASRGCR